MPLLSRVEQGDPPTTRVVKQRSPNDKSGTGISGDQLILKKYPWALYQGQTHTAKKVLESMVFRELLLQPKVGGATKPTIDTCTKFLDKNNNIRLLLLDCWKTGNFTALRSDACFLSLRQKASPGKDATTFLPEAQNSDNRGTIKGKHVIRDADQRPDVFGDLGNSHKAPGLDEQAAKNQKFDGVHGGTNNDGTSYENRRCRLNSTNDKSGTGISGDQLNLKEYPWALYEGHADNGPDVFGDLGNSHKAPGLDEQAAKNQEFDEVHGGTNNDGNPGPTEPVEESQEVPTNPQGPTNVEVFGGQFFQVAGNVVWQLNYNFEENEKIAKWFSSTNYRVTHNEIAKKRAARTGWWLLQSIEYAKWVKSPDQSLLWCPGIPGVGKTCIASLAVDHLRTLKSSSKQNFVGVIYFDYKLRSQQSKASVIDSLCRQVFEVLQTLYLGGDFEAIYKRNVTATWQSRPSEMELRNVLSASFKSFANCYIVLDALDEYLAEYSDKQIRQLIHELLSIGTNIKIFITSRVIGEMDSFFRTLGAGRREIVSNDKDMKLFLQERVLALRDQVDFDLPDEFCQDIVHKIFKASKNRFLMAELHMNLVSSKKQSFAKIEKALNNLPKGTDAIYTRVMEEMQEYSKSDRKLAMRAFMWVAYSCRPLTVAELQHALVTKPATKDISSKHAIPLSTITAVCAGLIVVQDHGRESKANDDRAIRLVHFTAQEFFDRIQPSYFADVHSEMFRTCLDFISINKPHLPLYGYAALHWGYHANAHPQPLNDEILQFLQRDDEPVRHSLDYILLQELASGRSYWADKAGDQGSNIFLAIYHSQTPVLSMLLSKIGVVPLTQERKTPLLLAVTLGHLDSVQAILSRCAAGFANDAPIIGDTLQRLRKCQLSGRCMSWPNAKDKNGRTSLGLAAKFGHESMVKLLLEHGVEADLPDNHGQRPLSFAAENGHEAIVRRLLTHGGVDINSRDSTGCTPLSYATQYGHVSIVHILLQHEGVKADLCDNFGQRPLLLAAKYGLKAIVELLLQRPDVDINSRDKYGKSPLALGVEHGHQSVVKLLLEHEDVDVNSEDKRGATPLFYAVRLGHMPIVKLLLEHEEVEVEVVSEMSQRHTPLMLAVLSGNESMIKLLLGHPSVDINSREDYSTSRLKYAAKEGDEDTVRLLLQHRKFEITPRDKFLRTPLVLAAANGHISIVKLLLEHSVVTVDSTDGYGRTLLSHAARYGRLSIVRLLLEHTDLEFNVRDNRGQTPLSLAAGYGHIDIVEFLLGCGRAGAIDSQDNSYRTPLSYAAQHGHLPIVKLLLERGGVDADSMDERGRTPFSYASQHGHISIMKALLGHKAGIRVDVPDRRGRTPLSHAAQAGQDKVAQLLIQRRDVHVNSRDISGRTPLSWAMQGQKVLRDKDPRPRKLQNEGVDTIRCILASKGVNVNLADKDGRTPLDHLLRAKHNYPSAQTVINLLRQKGAIRRSHKRSANRVTTYDILSHNASTSM